MNTLKTVRHGAKVTFTTGGTVQAGGGVYLKRSSDKKLLQACQAGVFTYVLTSRQMGKSSLMTHAAEQLRSLQIQPGESEKKGLRLIFFQ